MGISSAFNWLGNRVADAVLGDITTRLNQAGEAWLSQSRSLAPVRTGHLRAEEGYRVEGRTLVLLMGAPYDVFTEFGTRHMSPRPHVRPALNAIGRIWGGDIEMNFNALSNAAWQGVYAHQGGFIVPSAIQPRPLTHAQREHVRRNLEPTSKRLHTGNVKRARMMVRKFS